MIAPSRLLVIGLAMVHLMEEERNSGLSI